MIEMTSRDDAVGEFTDEQFQEAGCLVAIGFGSAPFGLNTFIWQEQENNG